MRVQYTKVCTKQEAEDIQRRWIESNAGLNAVPIERRYVWFRSAPKITVNWERGYSIKFVFTPIDPSSEQSRLV